VARARPYTILVVEDEPAVADLLVTLLRDEGYLADLARDGAAAISLIDQRRAAAQSYHAVLLDMMLPGVAGGEVLAHSLAVQRAAPVIAISADPGALGKALALGATASIGKPFDIADLLAVIERHCVPHLG
jgi:DNA-binding response OmpR family regulator